MSCPSSLTRAATLLGCASLLASASDALAQPPADDARRAMTAILDSAARAGFVGHVLAVRDGQPFFEASRGLADPASRTPVDSATIFSIGSVTKRFTHVAILRLEQQGRLSLSDPLSKWIDGLPEDKRAITLDLVLDMRAGFHEYHDTEGDTIPADHQRVSRDEALRRIAAQRLLFAPGQGREYSNSGYTLLAAVVERASGMSFPDYLRREIFAPAGMTSTGFYGDDRWDDRRMARGVGMRSFGSVNAPHRWPEPSWVIMGAGGMVSNARDLHRFIQSIRSGRLLGPAAQAKLYRRDPAMYAGGNDFGYGTLVLEFDGSRDVVIVNTNVGAPRMRVALPLAEAMRGQPIPDAIKQVFAAREEGPPPGATQQVEGGGNVQRRGNLPDTPQARTARALAAALRDGSDSALAALVNERFAPRFRQAVSMNEHISTLRQLSATFRNAPTVLIAPIDDSRFELRLGRTVVSFTVDAAPPHAITGMGIDDR